VKLCVAFGEMPLAAVIVIGKLPLVVAVPLSTPPELNVTPLGRVPVSLNDGTGAPVALTVNVPAVLTENAAIFALVITGGPRAEWVRWL